MIRATPSALLVAVVAMILAWQAAPSGLASRYAGDRGIERDPRVLFHEDFEGDGLDAVKQRWTEASDQDRQVLALTPGGPTGSGGKRCLQMTATLGKNTGGHLYKRLAREVDTLYARFYVRFAEDAPYIHHFVHLGGYRPATNWPQGGAGERPRGDERITVGIEPHGDNGRAPPPGLWTFYAYWHEMKVSADGRHWGNAMRSERGAAVPRGRWQCVEIMVKLNSSPDAADGELALWLDGVPTYRVARGTLRGPWTGLGFHTSEIGVPFEGFHWRTSRDLKLNFFWLLHYVTENAARQNNVRDPKPVNRVWFDDIVVATDYIGPLRSAGGRP